MRIAVTYHQGQIYPSFGHTPKFKFYDVDNGRIIREQIVDTPARKGHTILAGFLKKMSVDILICNKIGEEGKKPLQAAEIELFSGIKGNADVALKSLIAGTLSANETPRPLHNNQEANLIVPISFY